MSEQAQVPPPPGDSRPSSEAVRVRVELGRTMLPPATIAELGVGSVIPLDAPINSPVTVHVGDLARARGTAVVAAGSDAQPRLAVALHHVSSRTAVAPVAGLPKALARAAAVSALLLVVAMPAWAQSSASKKASASQPATAAADYSQERLGFQKHADSSARGSAASLGWPEVLQSLAALAVVIAMIFATRWVLRRLGQRGSAVGSSSVIQVLSRTSVGGRSQLLLVKLGSRLVLVGMNGQTMAGLAEVSDADEVAALESAAEQQGTDSLKNIFRGGNRSPLGQVAQRIRTRLEKKEGA